MGSILQVVELRLFLCLLLACNLAYAEYMSSVFSTDYRNQQVLRVEAALATAQAELGIIPASAANEIASKADIQFAPADDIAEEYKIVQHRMVALLNVWGRSLGEMQRNICILVRQQSISTTRYWYCSCWAPVS